MAYLLTPELTQLAVVAARAGLGNGVDFYIRGIPFSGRLESDLIGLSFDGSTYCVERRDPDRTRELLRTREFAEAARCFLDEAERTAAGYRPRRPHRPDPVPEPERHPSAVGTVLGGLALGVGFGLLILPVLAVLLTLAAAACSYGSGSTRTRRPWRGDRAQKLSFGAGTALGLAALAGIGYVLLTR